MKNYIIKLSKNQFHTYKESLYFYHTFLSPGVDIVSPTVLGEIPELACRLLKNINRILFLDSYGRYEPSEQHQKEIDNSCKMYKKIKSSKLELTESELITYREATEFYSRFLSGQMTLPNVLFFDNSRVRQELNNQLLAFKNVLFPTLADNESYGIGMDLENEIGMERQISYEMYREVYCQQVREDKEAGKNVGYNVYSSSTLKYSGEPLPVVKLKK